MFTDIFPENLPRGIDTRIPRRLQQAVFDFESPGLISKIISKDRASNAAGLGEAESSGHLLMLVHSGGIQRALPWHEKHLTAHPGIAAKLPASLTLPLPCALNSPRKSLFNCATSSANHAAS